MLLNPVEGVFKSRSIKIEGGPDNKVASTV